MNLLQSPDASKTCANPDRREFMTSVLGSAGSALLVARLGASKQEAKSRASSLKILAFDTFGTVVDWRSTVIEEGQALGKAKRLAIDWGAFADAWRASYQPSLDRVRRGELPWTKLDVLHRSALDELLVRFGIDEPA